MDANHQISLTEQTYDRWRSTYRGVRAEQLRELKNFRIGTVKANDPEDRLPGGTTVFGVQCRI